MSSTRAVCSVVLMTILTAACSDERSPDPKSLPDAQQFELVQQGYPAVAEYLTRSDALLDAYATLVPLDLDPSFVDIEDPELAERLREGLALSRCVRNSSGGCVRLECEPNEDCDLRCGRQPNQFLAALCEREEALCRQRRLLTCRLVEYQP